MGARDKHVLKALFTGTVDDVTPINKIATWNKNMTQEETYVFAQAKQKRLAKFNHVYD